MGNCSFVIECNLIYCSCGNREEVFWLGKPTGHSYIYYTERLSGDCRISAVYAEDMGF